ncbi:hypothetical protein DFH27DRAFT_290324 [Peziza echinospora]|nr:hypothetical protein DFH27DRAFT_290324 [Peziza echinospora]
MTPRPRCLPRPVQPHPPMPPGAPLRQPVGQFLESILGPGLGLGLRPHSIGLKSTLGTRLAPRPRQSLLFTLRILLFGITLRLIGLLLPSARRQATTPTLQGRSVLSNNWRRFIPHSVRVDVEIRGRGQCDVRVPVILSRSKSHLERCPSPEQSRASALLAGHMTRTAIQVKNTSRKNPPSTSRNAPSDYLSSQLNSATFLRKVF